MTICFRRTNLAAIPDIRLHGATVSEIYKQYGSGGSVDLTTESGSRILLSKLTDAKAMRNTCIHLAGGKNTIEIDGLASVERIDLACVDGATIRLRKPASARGMSIVASHGSLIEVGSECLISRDVLIYASNAHGLYSSLDGSRKSRPGIVIGDRVWLGQGARIISGANVGTGSVIGAYSVLAGRIPNNCAAAGNPCRVTSQDIFWTKMVTDDGNFFEELKQRGQPMPPFVRHTAP